MNSVEETLREMTRRTADEFTEADLSALRLQPVTFGGAAHRGRPAPRRRLAVLGAATAVLALLAGLIVVKNTLAGRGHESRPSRPPVTVTSGPLAGIPRYFVELRRGPQPLDLCKTADVVDSVTGKVLASVAVPKPYVTFAAVTAAGDDQTFVLAAENSPKLVHGQFHNLRTEFLELRITPLHSGGVSTVIHKLGLKIPVNWEGQGIALSPDGTRLAFTADPLTVIETAKVWVYSMATGVTRSWHQKGGIGFSPRDTRSLSWSPDDKTLAYAWDDKDGIYLLDTTAQGGGLLAHSRKLIGFSQKLTTTADADLTPDGSKVIASIYDRHVSRIDLFSAATGKLISSRTPAVLRPDHLFNVLWTNASGTLMIIDLYRGSSDSAVAALLHGSKLTVLRGIGATSWDAGLAW